jgi:ABC-type oligopeptide transport system substrate-binding subunit
MKIYKTLAAFLLSVSLLIGANSCTTYVFKKDSKPGWHKNPNNPHHPNTTNPGHTKSPKGVPPGQQKKSKMPR